MRAIPYCKCKLNTEQNFQTGWLIFGYIFDWGTIVFCLLSLMFFGNDPGVIFLSVVAAIVVWLAWYLEKLELKHQALYLDHDHHCADRYARLAAHSEFAKFGVFVEYPLPRKYKPLWHVKLVRLVGVRQAGRYIKWAKRIGWLLIPAIIVLLFILPSPYSN